MEPHSQEKQKKRQRRVREHLGNAGEPGTDEQENRESALRNICTAFLCKMKKTELNTVCVGPRDPAKTWEG